jgi:hypothetical protein
VTDTAAVVEARPDERRAAPDRSLLARLWAAPLAAHVLALVVALVVLAPLARATVATPDEGAYGLQAGAVAAGRWEVPSPLARFDPDDRFYPYAHSDEVDGRWYAYVRHPFVPAVLGRAVDLFGRDAGLLAAALAGTVGAALAAWALAAELDRRRCRAAFWLAAASPLLVDGFVIGAHTWAAALAGAAAVAAVRIGRRGPTMASTAGLAAALVSGALVRSESVLFAGGLLVCLGIARWRKAGFPAGVLAVALPGAALAAGLRLERWWVARIVGGGGLRDLVLRQGSGEAEPSYLVGRFQGLWHSTFEGGSSHGTVGTLLLPALVAVAALLVVRYRRDEGRTPELVLLAATAVYAVLWMDGPNALVRGLVPATPVLVIGVAAALALRTTRAAERMLLGAAGLFALALYATQYPDGGAFQWGGRFLTPVLVPLTVVAVGGLRGLVAARPPASRRPATVALAGLAAVVAVMGVASVGAARGDVAGIYDQVSASASPVNVTTAELLPRMMWREDLPWLRATPADLGPLLDRLRTAGVEQVTVVASPTDTAGPAARWTEVEDRGRAGPTALHITVLRQ